MASLSYQCLVYLTFAVKIIFIILAIYVKFLSDQSNSSQSNSTASQPPVHANAAVQTTAATQNILFWKDRFEFLFQFLIVIIIFINFYPRRLAWPSNAAMATSLALRPNIILVDQETSILLFTYGIVTLIENKWDFFADPAYAQNIKQFQSFFGGFSTK